MAKVYRDGTYLIRSVGDQPVLCGTDKNPLESPSFMTKGQVHIAFEIDDPSISFSEPPIAWEGFGPGQNPPYNSTRFVVKDGKDTLRLMITPPKGAPISQYKFTLSTNIGEIHRPTDPTIVENPPN